MALYTETWLSMVKFCKDTATEIAATLDIATPGFVNLDAHANMSQLPLTDTIGLVTFASHNNGKIITVYTSITVSTYDDRDNIRHIQIMGLLESKLEPGFTIPIYKMINNVQTKVSFLVVQGDVGIEPTQHDDVRSLQFINVVMLSGASGTS